MPWVPLAIAAVGAGTSIFGSLQGAKADKEAQVAKQHMENLNAARERTQQVREARIRAADVEQRGANQGASQSSSAKTGASGVYQQANSNDVFIGYQQQTGEAMSRAKQNEANAQGISDVGKGVSEVGMTVFNNWGNIKDNIFGTGVN